VAAGEYRPPPDLTQIDVCELLPTPEIPARLARPILAKLYEPGRREP
jgi:hypothetical protein